MAILSDLTDRELGPTMAHCILHWFPHTSKNKMTRKCIDLGRLLAKRNITSHWKAKQVPTKWNAEILKCEGVIRLQK